MKAPAFVHRGRVRARGVVVDVGLLGEAEARRRVVDLLGPGAEVRELDPDAWLVLLGEPVDLRTRSAPGLLLTDEGGRLVGAPGIESDARVALFDAGQVRTLDADAGRPIDPATWIETGDLPLVRLDPVVRPFAPAAAEPVAAPTIDLRAEARIGERPAQSRAIEKSLATPRTGDGWFTRLRRALGGGTRPGAPAGASAGGSRGVAQTRPPGLLARVLARLESALAATPFGDRARRAQEAYLERLLRQLEEDTDEGLRHALPLGGGGAAGLRSLRLPGRRGSLEIGPGRPGQVGGMGVGMTAYQVLTLAYRRAAERLEAEGHIEESAFVWVELLGMTDLGVALLERRGHHEAAARVAEMRNLDPAVPIRLWWKAGDRERAIAIARRHGLFADVVSRASDDPERARALRTAWVEALERSGDLAGAVAAGWPDPFIRPHLGPIVRRGLALRGPAGAAMLAYRLELDPDEGELDATRAWLDERGADDTAEIRAFLVAFATVTCEPALDRELASRLQRAVLRARWPSSDGSIKDPLRRLRNRVDRVLAADLPSLAHRGAQGEELVAPRQPAGLLPVSDACALPSGHTLVALGERGCVLLAPGGRAAARWDVPTDRLVPADHGTACLLLSVRGEVVAVSGLDLADRRVRPYGVISARRFAESSDGSLWPVADERGLAFYDLLADRPTVAWRELEPGWRCAAIARAPDQLAAVVVQPTNQGQRAELWIWTLPGITLRERHQIGADLALDTLVLLTGTSTVWHAPGGQARVGAAGSGINWFGNERLVHVLGSAAALGLVREAAGGTELKIHRTINQTTPALTVALGSVGQGFRASGGRVAAWDGEGRLVTADLDAGRLVTVTRLA